MNYISTSIAVLAVISILALAIRYIVKEKRKGKKCIGCPYCDGCAKQK